MENTLEYWLQPENTVIGRELKAYFMEHVDKIKPAGFYVVKKPLKVFKKTYREKANGWAEAIITALIIPVGATIYADAGVFFKNAGLSGRKMRASKVIVDSNWDKHGGQYKGATFSGYQTLFKYKPSETVVPTTSFSNLKVVCAPGIHFFLNFRDAYYY